MKVTRQIHPMWEEWKKLKALPEYKDVKVMQKSLVGKFHYHYENENGSVGLISIQGGTQWHPRKKTWSTDNMVWETCGALGYSRFATKKQAEKAIAEKLKEPIPA